MTQTLRVLSYNIHKGFTTGNRKFVLEGIKEAIRIVNADLVFLQEVQGEHGQRAQKIDNWPTISQFEFLADEMWPHFAYGKNAVYTEGHHGNAILSRYPISAWENLDVSTHQFERRGLLHAVVDVPGLGAPLDCLCIHLGLTGKGRRFQLTKICERVEAAIPEGHPCVIAGDFNDWSGYATNHLATHIGVTEIFKALNGHHARTFPCRLPVLQLDRIYSRGFQPQAAKVLRGAPWEKLSDHAALYAEIVAG